MTATCEFLTLEKKDVLLIPSQAVIREGEKTYVQVKSSDPKMPARKEIKVGEVGNEGTEVLDGLKEGDEVVTATIDLKALRETQEKMQAAQEGGGLAGGQGPRMGTRQTGAGGTRPGAGMSIGGGSGGGAGRAGGR